MVIFQDETAFASARAAVSSKSLNPKANWKKKKKKKKKNHDLLQNRTRIFSQQTHAYKTQLLK